MSARRRVIRVEVDAEDGTAEAEALIAAAELHVAAALVDAEHKPLDGGLLAYCRDTLRLARETLELRRRFGQ